MSKARRIRSAHAQWRTAGVDSAVVSGSARSGHEPPHLVWRTEEDGKAVDYDSEPARSGEQKTAAEVLSLLPLDDEL